MLAFLIFLQLYSKMDEMKIFSNISPIYATKASRKFININLMMWDIETNNLDSEKMLK